jgi:hypothetical protein
VTILRKNWLLATGAAVILAGFAFLAGGFLSVGPLLLVVGYCLLLPIYLWRNFLGGVGE